MEATACIDEYVHAVPGVMYVVTNIPGPGVSVESFEEEYSVGCSCTDRCGSDCSCTRGCPNYSTGRLVEDKVAPVIECNSICSCSRHCGNRLVQNGPLDSLTVTKIGEKGLGLITTKRISKGQFVCEYAGEVIGIEEARRRVEVNKQRNNMNYVLVVSEHVGDQTIVTCIDPMYFGNIGRYCNHSCDPNTRLVPVRVEGPVPRLCLFTTRNVEIGEELTFGYADGIASSSVQDLSDTPCLCNSINCSGYLPHNQI